MNAVADADVTIARNTDPVYDDVKVFETVKVVALVVLAIEAPPVVMVNPVVVTVKPPAIVAPPVTFNPELVIVVPPLIEAPAFTVTKPSPRTLNAEPPEFCKSRKVNVDAPTVFVVWILIKLLRNVPPVKEFETEKVETAA